MKRIRSGIEALPRNAYEAAEDTTVLMPIGGMATRARSVTKDAIPKHLLPLGGQTVLDVVCQGLQRVGFRNFVFCVGHLKDQIREYIAQGLWIKEPGVQYELSEETKPLGADGAVLHAISALGLRGHGMVVPGDVMLPWQGLAAMAANHHDLDSDLTVGVTSYVTERTTDIGKMIIEDDTSHILRCYGRTETPDKEYPKSRAMTSAASTALYMPSYIDMCQRYNNEKTDQDALLSVRDHILPLASQIGEFTIRAFDVEGEVLDLGTPANIKYGQANWQQYT